MSLWGKSTSAESRPKWLGGDGAQGATFTGTGTTTTSNTFISVGTVTGQVSNVEPWPTSAATGSPAGSGYLTTPTLTITAGSPEAITTAVGTIRGEDTSSGGNINTKYISRRVTLEDGFDARDLKVIVNAYKPVGTGLHVYYKVKADEDPEDFDTKNYVLMPQETTSSLYSGALQDIKEYIFKTTDEKITYSSGNADYDKF